MGRTWFARMFSGSYIFAKCEELLAWKKLVRYGAIVREND